MSSFLFLVMHTDRTKGYPFHILVNPGIVPEKYRCPICKNLVRQAVQLPQLTDPKIVCFQCHQESCR